MNRSNYFSFLRFPSDGASTTVKPGGAGGAAGGGGGEEGGGGGDEGAGEESRRRRMLANTSSSSSSSSTNTISANVEQQHATVIAPLPVSGQFLSNTALKYREVTLHFSNHNNRLHFSILFPLLLFNRNMLSSQSINSYLNSPSDKFSLR